MFEMLRRAKYEKLLKFLKSAKGNYTTFKKGMVYNENNRNYRWYEL